MTCPDAILLNRSRPEVRAVWEDYKAERGARTDWLTRYAQRSSADDADDADAADADDGAADDAAVDDAAADAAADADADDAADDADDDAAAAADDARVNINRFWRGEDMREGLLLIQVPGRYWGVTRVGYAKRIEGDEWEFRGVTVVRTGAVRTLADLAANGPKKDHAVYEADAVPELLHRFTPRRVLVANEAVWAKHLKGAKDE